VGPRNLILTVVTMGLAAAAVVPVAGAARKLTAAPAKNGDKPMSHGIYDFRVATIDGEQKSLADYRGRTLLIVNTASRCGFTPQYTSLEALYQRYKDRGFEILAFPANNFMGQEPGTNAEIKEFCSLKYRTTFPLFEKVSVKGKDIAPLYAYLTRDSGHPGGISWNFAKFLVGPDGRVIARFDPATDPLDENITKGIESSLAKR
jgi:glutathione peroxidase